MRCSRLCPFQFPERKRISINDEPARDALPSFSVQLASSLYSYSSDEHLDEIALSLHGNEVTCASRSHR